MLERIMNRLGWGRLLTSSGSLVPEVQATNRAAGESIEPPYDPKPRSSMIVLLNREDEKAGMLMGQFEGYIMLPVFDTMDQAEEFRLKYKIPVKYMPERIQFKKLKGKGR